MIRALDLSQFQGTNINFNQVKGAGYLIGFTRMTYAYPGQTIMIDSTANANYYGMVSAEIYPGGYHKVGWTDPIAEADAFVNAMSPLAKNDGLMYDIEPASDVAIPANWSEWEQQFVQRIWDRTHTYPFRYLNVSMTNAMPKQGIVVNCPSWVAAPSFGWNATLPVDVVVIMQQGPTAHIPGITMNICDTDMFFGTIEEYLKCTYQPEVSVSQPTTPVSTPTIVQITSVQPSQSPSQSSPSSGTVTVSAPVVSTETNPATTPTTPVTKVGDFISPPVSTQIHTNIDNKNKLSSVANTGSLDHTNTYSNFSKHLNSPSWWNRLVSAIINFFRNF